MRCLSGGFCLSLAVLTFGVQGLSGGGAPVLAVPSPSLASGVVGPGTLKPGTLNPGTADALAAVAGAGPMTTAALTADALALVAYSRSTVETTSKDGVPGELNVAFAGLKRPAEGFLMAPLESLQESSSFGLRTSPITGSSGEFHWGQDFAAACGTRVYSADSGVVRAVGWHPWGGGNRVEIDHGNGLITTYNHLEAIAVKKGDSVRVGEVIARVGTTGSSTGCHLHFETILNGSHKNPRDWVLLPTVQSDQLGNIEMRSYSPDSGMPSNASLGWAIPGSDDGRHLVAGGAQEARAAVVARTPFFTSAAATPTPSIWDAISPTRTRSGTPTLESSQAANESPGGTTAPGGSQTSAGTTDPGTPTGPVPGTPEPLPPETPTATPSPEPTAPPVPPTVVEPPPTSSAPPLPSEEPPPPVVEPVLPPPPPPVVEPVLPPPPPPPVEEPVLPPPPPAPVPTSEPAPPPPPPVVEPVLPPPPPAPVPTSEPAPPAPEPSGEPSATTDPSLTPGP